MKTIVLGASGHIGSAVTRELVRRGDEVTAAGRRIEPPINLGGVELRYVSGDLDIPGEIDRIVEGHDFVVDAAAPYPSYLAPPAEGAGASVEHARRRTRALIDAVHRHHARLAYVSSFATLPDNAPGLEGLQRRLIRQMHPYFSVKQTIEADLIEAARAGLPVVIVNPTLCIGPWDIKTRDLCFIPRLLCGEAPASVAHAINVMDVRDIALGLVAGLEAEHYGKPILLAGHNISVEALYTWICEIGGVTPPTLVAPITLGAVATYLNEVMVGATGSIPPLPALAPMLTMLHNSFDPSDLQVELGITPLPLSRTLTDAIDWYRRIGYC